MAKVECVPSNEFRKFEKVKPLAEDHFIGLNKEDIYEWSEAIISRPEFVPIFGAWKESIKTPFYGVTTDGNKIDGLYTLQDEGAPTKKMVAAANHLLEVLSPEEKEKVVFDLDDENWRKWSNPELIFFDDTGLRLDQGVKQSTIDAVLGLLEAALSEEGYKKATDALLTNEFLGQLADIPKILNRWSYFIMVFGQPSETEPWGFTWHGHHLCINVFVVRNQMTIGPCFVGVEPNVIDSGPNKGVFLCDKEGVLGLELMQALPPDLQKRAVIYEMMHDPAMPDGRWNPADQRHLAGAYQDNRVIPYEGILATEMTAEQQAKLWETVEAFLELLPVEPRKHRMHQIKAHVDETHFSWIGRHGNHDVFYYRIQSPVVLLEFDHHASWLFPAGEPVKHHIHTTQRLPNGNDYGRELIRLFRESHNKQ